MKSDDQGWLPRTLVTGGAGFVGSHLVSRLLELGSEVTVVDLWDRAARTPLRALGHAERVHYLQVDVRDAEELRSRAGGGYGLVFHLAAQPISPLSNVAGSETLSRNVDGTRGVASFVRGGAARAMLLASSACAYGVPDPGDCPLREDAPLREGHYLYTRSKQQAERVVQEARVPAGIARFVNLFGPADWHCSRLAPRIIRQLLDGEPLALRRSSGDSVLDFLYVADAVEGLIALARRVAASEAGGARGERAPVYNFGTSEPVRVRDFAQSISRAYDGQTRPIRSADRFAEPPMSKYLSSDRAGRELGWTAHTPRAAALERTIRWYRDHAGALEPLEAGREPDAEPIPDFLLSEILAASPAAIPA